MTPAEALQILAQAASLAHMPARDHATCQQAAQILGQAIAPPKPPAPAPTASSPCG